MRVDLQYRRLPWRPESKALSVILLALRIPFYLAGVLILSIGWLVLSVAIGPKVAMAFIEKAATIVCNNLEQDL